MRQLNDDVMGDASLYDQKYMHGFENKGIRYYYYLNTGLGILNQFRNLFLGIFGLYVVLHLSNPFLLVLMLIPSVVGLTILGYYNVHTMNKVMEWIGIRFSSHYAIRQFNYHQGTYELLDEIKCILKGYGHHSTAGGSGRDSKKSDAAKKGKAHKKRSST